MRAPPRCAPPTQLAAGATVDLPVGLTAVSGSFGAVGPVTVSAAAPDADPATTVTVAVTALAPVLSLEAEDPHILLRGDGTGTARFTVRREGGGRRERRRDADPAREPAGRPRLRRAASRRACTASADERTVTCDLATVAAGSTKQVLVNVRWAGSAKQPATVVVQALGATARSQSTVQTSSAGLDAAPQLRAGGRDRDRRPAPVVLADAARLQVRARERRPGQQRARHGAARRRAAAVLDARAARSRCRPPARLDVPAGREVLFAGLYWSANVGPRTRGAAARESARLRGPGGAYVNVAGTVVAEPTDNASRRTTSRSRTSPISCRRAARAPGRSPTSPSARRPPTRTGRTTRGGRSSSCSPTRRPTPP